MIFHKLRNKYFDKEYFKKYKYDENAEKVSVHLRISPEIANDFVDVISVYRGYGIDKHELIKSELASIIFKEFLNNLPDDESALLDIFSKIKAYRDEKELKTVSDGGVAYGEC